MKIQLITFIAALAALSAQAADRLPAHLGAEGYVLSWHDEFDGDSLDRRAWNVEVNGTGCGNHELQHYIDAPEAVSVADGCLLLTAIRRPYGDSHQFTSGRVNTHGKVTFTYGIIEARIKLPSTADGLWPAFWMMGDDISSVGWPACGETDILEMGHANGIAAGSQDKLFNGAMHYGSDAGRHIQQVGEGTSTYSLQDGKFHHFYVVWTPKYIRMYVDKVAEPYLSVDIDATQATGADSTGAYFHKPNFLLFNLAVGGDFTGIHNPDAITALGNAEGSKASMEIDYVRIYTPAGIASND